MTDKEKVFIEALLKHAVAETNRSATLARSAIVAANAATQSIRDLQRILEETKITGKP